MTYRLLPQTNYYAQMKLEHLSHWQEQGFKGYRSPWIPVCEANESMLARGDLILSEGFDSLHKLGRDIQVIDNGKVIMQKTIFRRPDFVWIDTRKHDAEPYLRENPHAERYGEYTALLEEALRGGYIVLQDTRFPLFHETSVEAAQNILQGGIDIIRVKNRCVFSRGSAFCLMPTFQSALRKGHASGAVIKFDSLPGDKQFPKALFFSISPDDNIDQFLQGRMCAYEEPPYYTWRTVCSELSASVLFAGIVYLYDNLEKFNAVEVIETG